ncbi:MAG: permease-like cell division protein FtsX [Symbiobacteriaceae bacterium]|nr:permease-like cell division protein FtsX [Symbiobacteriaceae bacterium]
MRLQTLWYYLLETTRSLRRNIWMACASIITVTLAMLILGFFASLLYNLDFMATQVETQLEVTCFLRDYVTSDDLRPLLTKILDIPGVIKADFITRDQALERLNSRMGGSRVDLLTIYQGSDNPLQDSYVIRASSPEIIPAIAASLIALPEVDDVIYGNNFIKQLLSFTSLVRISGAMVMLGLAGAALFIVVNTIRLTVDARRNEINIMRFVGATSWFIRVPFILEGLLLGFVGALVAFQLTAWLYHQAADYIAREISFISMAGADPFLGTLRLWLFAAGTLFGILGSSITIGRYLHV